MDSTYGRKRSKHSTLPWLLFVCDWRYCIFRVYCQTATQYAAWQISHAMTIMSVNTRKCSREMLLDAIIVSRVLECRPSLSLKVVSIAVHGVGAETVHVTATTVHQRQQHAAQARRRLVRLPENVHGSFLQCIGVTRHPSQQASLNFQTSVKSIFATSHCSTLQMHARISSRAAHRVESLCLFAYTARTLAHTYASYRFT
jgi:hypothetical protein